MPLPPIVEPGSSINVMLLSGFSRTIALYFHAHGAHWNVVGPTFGADHEFFGKIAAMIYESIDAFAETMRSRDIIVPYTLNILSAHAPYNYAKLDNQSAMRYYDSLAAEIRDLLAVLLDIKGRVGETSEDIALASFVEDEIKLLNKILWFLTSAQHSLLTQ